MAAIDFPASPTVGQVFTPANGVVYTWNGTVWLAASASTLPAAHFYAAAGWTWGSTSSLALPIDTTRFNYGAGTFSTTGAPNGSHLWMPGPGVWSIQAGTLCYADLGQMQCNFYLQKFPAGGGGAVTVCQWGGYLWQFVNSTPMLAVTIQLAAGDGLQLQLDIAGSLGGFNFGGDPYTFLSGHRVKS